MFENTFLVCSGNHISFFTMTSHTTIMTRKEKLLQHLPSLERELGAISVAYSLFFPWFFTFLCLVKPLPVFATFPQSLHTNWSLFSTIDDFLDMIVSISARLSFLFWLWLGISFSKLSYFYKSFGSRQMISQGGKPTRTSKKKKIRYISEGWNVCLQQAL